MSKYLVIVESPAKAKTIARFLGKNYTVKASVGHLRDLPKSKMGIDIEDDFEPQYITIRGKGPVVSELRKEAKKAEKVILATDPDREGEAIAWHLMSLLEKQASKFERVSFNAITKEKVKEAINSSRKIDMDLVDAQQARRILDRLVGYSISPLLWAKIRKGLSAGRVQSVASKLICDKEEEIKAFIPEEYWIIEALLEKDKKKFIANFIGKNSKKEKIENKEQKDKIISELKDTFVAETIKKTKKKRQPYLCFTTSTLQQEASNKLGFSTKKTMSVAQRLYEGVKIGRKQAGLITYMRTDSTRVDSGFSKTVAELITENFGTKYLGKLNFSKTSKAGQDAHEAIRPTSLEYSPSEIEKYLDKDQFKLYDLIWRRAIASHMAPAEFEQLSVDFNNASYTFRSNGQVMKFDGFIKVYKYTVSKDTELPIILKDELFKSKNIKPEQHFTKPPARYTEASLVKVMEELGIGRPSTYSPTISTIISRGYIEREKKQLMPTELGFIVNDIMKSHFSTIINVEFTAGLEKKLDDVVSENLPWKSVIREFYTDFKPALKLADEEMEKINMDRPTGEACELCGKELMFKHGRFGKFIACSNYPECKNTKPILDKIGVKCPLCKEGDVIRRKTKKYKDFYGCSKYPDCNFLSWNKPLDERCPDCNKILVEQKNKRTHVIRCIDNKECKYKRKVIEEE